MNKQSAGEIMAFDTRELFARLIKCEAGGEGLEGMLAVASVIINRANVPDGEFARVSNGGDVRAIIEQENQFTCLKTSANGGFKKINLPALKPPLAVNTTLRIYII